MLVHVEVVPDVVREEEPEQEVECGAIGEHEEQVAHLPVVELRQPEGEPPEVDGPQHHRHRPDEGCP